MTLIDATPPFVSRFIEDVRTLLEELENKPNLAPVPDTNRLFIQLVGLARTRLPAGDDLIMGKLLEDGMLARLHQLSARGEDALELYWSERLRAEKNVVATLGDFPYLHEYEQLVAQETTMLKGVMPELRRVVFIGSGPLPLSAYLMASQHGMEVDMVDVSMAAHACAMGWLQHTSTTGHLRCLHADARDGDFPLAHYDAVILASLAGVDAASKKTILANIAGRMEQGQHLLVRSADGMKRILYQHVEKDLLEGFEIMQTWVPEDDVINSVILARKI